MRTGPSLFLLFVIALFSAACSPNGELISPPAGLEQAVQAQLNADNFFNFKFTGLSVRAYPRDVFLVTVDVDMATKNANDQQSFPTKGQRIFVAQKAFQGDKSYWQVTKATKDQMRILGIKADN